MIQSLGVLAVFAWGVVGVSSAAASKCCFSKVMCVAVAEEERDDQCLTILVRGMMKSKSGAT